MWTLFVVDNFMDLCVYFLFFFNDTATTEIYTLSLHDALPILNFQNFEAALRGSRSTQDDETWYADSRGQGCLSAIGFKRSGNEKFFITLLYGMFF